MKIGFTMLSKCRLEGKDDKKVAYCAKCVKTIELSNMGEQALKLHMKGKKHFKNAETIQTLLDQQIT